MDERNPVDVVWQGATEGHFDPSPLVDRLTMVEALEVQLEVLDRWRNRGERVGGWKVGLTSGRARDAFGVGVRPFGFILESRIVPSGSRIPHAAIGRAGVENELCFVIGTPLSGDDADAGLVRKALAGVAPAFEINQFRLDGEADGPVRIADNLSHWGLVVGDLVSPLPAALDYEAITVVLSRDGREVEAVGARGHIDDHFESIARLTRDLAAFGIGLQPGDHVITGSYTRQSADAPGRWDADFGPPLGAVSVELV
jgi:2-keto-4-pentenoate hydratase